MGAEKITKNAEKAVWIMMIEDLKEGAGYSYAQIAQNTELSFSEIKKLITGRRHQPRFHVYQAILAFYCKTFYGREKLPHAERFLRVKKNHPLEWLEEYIFIGCK